MRVCGETGGGRIISVALQEEAAVALCSFLSVPLTCRRGKSREVSWEGQHNKRYVLSGIKQPTGTKPQYGSLFWRDTLFYIHIFCSILKGFTGSSGQKERVLPWELGSGSVSLATKCMTVVRPGGSFRASDKQMTRIWLGPFSSRFLRATRNNEKAT